MQRTGNLNLKKPEGTDIVDITDLNDNMDILDSEVSRTASTAAPGRMSAADKAKLDGIAAGANNYVHPANHPASIITQDASSRFVTDTEKAAWNAKAGTSVATTSANGLMSSGDKSKLDGIAAGAQPNSVTSVAGRTGAVALTKTDVGLASVQNYGIATQAQAEVGTHTTSYMTPQRTKQAIDTRLLNNVQMRVNAGQLEFNDGTGWKAVASGNDYEPYTDSVALRPTNRNTWYTVFDITGEGEIDQVYTSVNSGSGFHMFRITVDDVVSFQVNVHSGELTGFFMPDQLTVWRNNTADIFRHYINGTASDIRYEWRPWGYVETAESNRTGAVLSTRPVRFHESFKVEVLWRVETNSANTITFIKGGVK